MSERHWTKQNRIRVVEYSRFEVSDPSEVPRFVRELIFNVFQEVKLICVRSIKSCSRVPHFLREKYSLDQRFTLVLRPIRYSSVRLPKLSIWAQIADFVPENPLENTFSRKLRNEPVFRFYEKNQVLFQVLFGLRNPKMASDVKSDLVMTPLQRRLDV